MPGPAVYNARAVRYRSLILLALLLAGPLPAGASHVPVEVLLQRMFTDPSPAPYEAGALFEGDMVAMWRGGRLTVKAAGSYREWRATPGGLRRRHVTITRLDLPLVLRPFEANLKKLLAERVEQEEGTLALLDEYDVFIAEELPAGRFLLGAVRKDIVTDIIRRYGQASDLRDAGVRRAVARWLYQPGQRALVTRPGGPFLITAEVDEEGTYYSLLLTYDWGPVGTEIDWVRVGGRLLWRQVKMDTSLELRGLGRIDGQMHLRFRDHCFNSGCRR